MKFVKIRCLDEQNKFIKMYKDYVQSLAPYNPSIKIQLAEDYASDYLTQEFLGGIFVYLLKTQEDKTVGFIIVGSGKMGTAPKTNWCIHEFYILPEYRRKGFGIKTLEKFQKMHTGKVCYFVLKQNTPAQAFWKAATERLKWTALPASKYENRTYYSDEFADFFVVEVQKLDADELHSKL